MGVRLPAEYQEVEYLYSDGNQYIDSGIECTSDLVVDFSFVAYTDVNAAFCGGVVSTSSNVYFRHHCSPYYGAGLDLNFYWCQHNSASKASIRYNFQINKRYYAYINPLTGVAVVNGEEKTFTPVQTGLTTGKNFGIFARISGSGAVQSRPVSIYYFKFYRNDALIGDFIPCYRKSDSKPGMYDLVSGTFFVNQGTGEFLVGPDVIDSISPLMVAWRRIMMAAASVAKKLKQIMIENGFTLAGDAKTETDRLLNEKGYDIQLKWLILTQSATFTNNKMLAVFNNTFFHRRASGASIVNQNYDYGSNTYLCVGSSGDVYTIFDYNPLNPLIKKTVITDAQKTNAEEVANFILANAPDDEQWYLVCKDISSGNIAQYDFAFVYVHNRSVSIFCRYTNSSGGVQMSSLTTSYIVNINTGEKLFYIPIPVSAN